MGKLLNNLLKNMSDRIHQIEKELLTEKVKELSVQVQEMGLMKQKMLELEQLLAALTTRVARIEGGAGQIE